MVSIALPPFPNVNMAFLWVTAKKQVLQWCQHWRSDITSATDQGSWRMQRHAICWNSTTTFPLSTCSIALIFLNLPRLSNYTDEDSNMSVIWPVTRGDKDAASRYFFCSTAEFSVYSPNTEDLLCARLHSGIYGDVGETHTGALPPEGCLLPPIRISISGWKGKQGHVFHISPLTTA